MGWALHFISPRRGRCPPKRPASPKAFDNLQESLARPRFEWPVPRRIVGARRHGPATVLWIRVDGRWTTATAESSVAFVASPAAVAPMMSPVAGCCLCPGPLDPLSNSSLPAWPALKAKVTCRKKKRPKPKNFENVPPSLGARFSSRKFAQAKGAGRQSPNRQKG